MAETYRIVIKNSEISFEKAQFSIPGIFNKPKQPESMEIFCRMGDPENLECLVWKHMDKPESIFSLSARGEPCFYALADSGLAFALSLGYFGKLCANVRYGLDIFEEFGEDDA